MKVEVAVLGLVVSVDVEQHVYFELNSELRSCVKVEVAVLGLVVSVDVEQQQ